MGAPIFQNTYTTELEREKEEKWNRTIHKFLSDESNLFFAAICCWCINNWLELEIGVTSAFLDAC